MRSNLNTDDIQIGRDVLSFGEVLDGATERPGEVLTILREGTGESVQQVALATGIKVLTLQAYEAGASTPPLAELIDLAKHFGADRRLLMQAFGHVKAEAAAESMGIAAMFDGQLTPEEKAQVLSIVEAAALKKQR